MISSGSNNISSYIDVHSPIEIISLFFKPDFRIKVDESEVVWALIHKKKKEHILQT